MVTLLAPQAAGHRAHPAADAGRPAPLVATAASRPGSTGDLPPDIGTPVQRTHLPHRPGALTNVRKHAPGAAAIDTSADDGADFTVTVTNTPPTRPTLALPGARHGLVGIQERAELLDGTFESGPTPATAALGCDCGSPPARTDGRRRTVGGSHPPVPQPSAMPLNESLYGRPPAPSLAAADAVRHAGSSPATAHSPPPRTETHVRRPPPPKPLPRPCCAAPSCGWSPPSSPACSPCCCPCSTWAASSPRRPSGPAAHRPGEFRHGQAAAGAAGEPRLPDQ